MRGYLSSIGVLLGCYKFKKNIIMLDEGKGIDFGVSVDCVVDDSAVDDSAADGSAELFEHFAVTVDSGQGLLRVDKFLKSKLDKTSRARIQVAADRGYVLVGGVSVKSSYKVKPGDEVQMMLPFERREVVITAEDIPLSVVYEDASLLVVDKPAGLVVHPGHGNFSGTLVNALAYHLRSEPLFGDGCDLRAGLVHRIDKNTSGLLVVAKHTSVHAHLANQFFHHTTQRTYHALVWGCPKETEGTITTMLGRNLKNRLQMAVLEDDDVSGKLAITHYKVLHNLGYVSLIECTLETGRTHQIRVHMKHLGHPLFNDERYGGDRILRGTTYTKYKQFVNNCFTILPRHALHAMSLGFVHPVSGDSMSFVSPYPADFEACLNKWKAYGQL